MLPEIEGFKYIQGAFDVDGQRRLLAELRAVLEEAPLYTPAMPRTGKPLSVRMSNCGPMGWVTDRAAGYPGRVITIWARPSAPQVGAG